MPGRKTKCLGPCVEEGRSVSEQCSVDELSVLPFDPWISPREKFLQKVLSGGVVIRKYRLDGKNCLTFEVPSTSESLLVTELWTTHGLFRKKLIPTYPLLYPPVNPYTYLPTCPLTYLPICLSTYLQGIREYRDKRVSYKGNGPCTKKVSGESTEDP